MQTKKKISLMLVVILIMQIMLPMLTVMFESGLTTVSAAYEGTQYYINTAQDMWDFAEAVNNGDTFEGVTVCLNNDIDLGCTEQKQWIPIGYKENQDPLNLVKIYFAGTFEGNNKSIEGIYINSENITQGLFGVIKDGIVQNLTIKNSQICSSGDNVGGIAGYIKGNSIIDNCINMAEVKCNKSPYGTVGGIAGTNNSGRIQNCTNKGKIGKEAGQVGGIVGENYRGIVTNCNNLGIIERTTETNNGLEGTGGIAGVNWNSTIENSTNNYDIESNCTVGGIVGYNSKSEIINCQNNGCIVSSYYCGGIAGKNGDEAKIQRCYNNGNIIGETNSNYAYYGQGGIAGLMMGTIIEACINNGELNIISEHCNYVGGIVGTFRYEGQYVKNCINNGNINASSNGNRIIVGGIIGDISNNNDEKTKYLNGCRNFGSINVTENNTPLVGETGGIVGEATASQGKIVITDCYNKGNINANGSCAGGIIGETGVTNGHSTAGTMEINNCYNNGNICCNCNNKYIAVSVGGIVGDNRSTFSSDSIINISNCYNKGNVSGQATISEKGAVCYLGGCVGHNCTANEGVANIYNTYNTGKIITSESENEHAGPIYGRNSGNITNSYYLETVINNITEIDDVESRVEAKTKEYMKSDDFIIDLNKNTNVWGKDNENINEGYPIFYQHEHTFNKGTVTTFATCEKEGVKTYTCTKCGEIKTESIPALGHNYENGICTRCGKEEPKIEVQSGTYKIEETYITDIQPKTTVEELIRNIPTNATQKKVYKKGQEVGTTEKVGTGMIIEFTKQDETISFEIVVLGDVTGNDGVGDGEADFKDIVKMNKHRLGKSTLTGAYEKAGEVTGDGILDFKDIVRVNKFRLNKITSL